MIRTGYLRWEIDVTDGRSAADARAREVAFRARPSYRVVRIQGAGPHEAAAQRFLRGEETYDAVLRALERDGGEVDVTIPDVGPHVFRYSESDRARTPRFWMEKLQREAAAFAHRVVQAAGQFPRLVAASPALRAGYARLVAHEVFRVIEGRSVPAPTREDEPMRLDGGAYRAGVPELVAAELVRDVVDPEEFDEFRHLDRVTVRSGDKFYRIPRQSHGLIEVWDAKTLRGEARLCVVFQDPGMPPSDEVVMKYLLAKHQPELLWQVGVRFGPPTGRLDEVPARRRISGR